MIDNLRRLTPLHAHDKNTLHYKCGLRINNPVMWIIGAFDIALGDIDRQRNALLTFGFLDSSYLAASIPDIKFIKAEQLSVQG